MTSRPRPPVHLAPNTQDPAAPPAAAATLRAHRPRLPMTRAALTALLSHWRRHPLQLATLVLGLALATALWSGVQAINAEARAAYDRAAAAVGGGVLPALVDPAGPSPRRPTSPCAARAGSSPPWSRAAS